MERIKILFVDDEEEIRLAMQAVILSQGWVGKFAKDVEEAIEFVKDSEPDIIIMDYHLPKIDGITGTRMLRQLLPRTPILIFTIEDDQEVADRFLEAGATDFAIKPLRAPDIIARIRLHIKMLGRDSANVGPVYNEKGISTNTLSVIADFLRTTDAATVEEIAAGTGLAYQTVYRYIQHMVDRGTVTMDQAYGKIGRPKRRFRLM